MLHPSRRALLAAVAIALAAPTSALADVTIDRLPDGTVTAIGTATGEGGGLEVWIGTQGDLRFTANGDGYTIVAADPDHCYPAGGSDWSCGDGPASSVTVDVDNPDKDYMSLSEGILETGGSAQVNAGDGDNEFYARDADYPVSAIGGSGNDTFRLGTGNDTAVGGAGDDRFEGGLGDDLLQGGAGNDYFLTDEDGTDGADTFDGGSHGSLDPETYYRGDTISYEDRTVSTTVTLPLISAPSPVGGMGAPGENDAVLGIEVVYGGMAGNTLIGNDDDNELAGGIADDTIGGGPGNDVLNGSRGSDSLSGDAGDDTLFARQSYEDPAADPDAALSCGDGADTLWRGSNDPDPADCEQDVPGFSSRVQTMVGTLQAGVALSIAGTEAFGDPGLTSVTWSSCSTVEYDDCKELATSPTFVPSGAEVGRYLYADVDLKASYGKGDRGFAELRGPVAAAAPVVPAPAPAPAPPFETAVIGAATKALGAGMTPAPDLALGAGVVAFKPKSVSGGTLPVGTKSAPVLGIACQAACQVNAKPVLKLPGARKGAKTVSVKLKTVNLKVGAGQVGVIKVKTNPAQRKAIGRAKKPKITIKVSVKNANGTTTTDSKTFKVKAVSKKAPKKK